MGQTDNAMFWPAMHGEAPGAGVGRQAARSTPWSDG